MCCFSITTPVGWFARLFAVPVRVSATNIFARMVADGRQALAYGMNLSARAPIALVLPLPVAPGSGEDAVRFVDLAAEPRMFAELRELFEPPRMAARKTGGLALPSVSRPRLIVHAVGSFVASYVPTVADFDRLDPQFRLPRVLFDAVPRYADHGFAVFQLAPGKVTVHPMALSFPTRDPARLFFPTVHVHDGRFHATARFDHALYFQTPRHRERPTTITLGALDRDVVGWMMPHKDYAGLVVPQQPLVRRTLHGRRANDDTWLPA